MQFKTPSSVYSLPVLSRMAGYSLADPGICGHMVFYLDVLSGKACPLRRTLSAWCLLGLWETPPKLLVHVLETVICISRERTLGTDSSACVCG